VDKADDLQMVNESMVPPLLDAILLDYQRNVPDARDAEVLNVVTTIIHKLRVRWTPNQSRHLVRGFAQIGCCTFADFSQNMMDDKVAGIMDSVFECTLEMINKDFHEYPEFRVEFFKLLQAINLYCFPALLKLDGRQFKFVIDSCMWASKHDNREVESTGLAMCLELINNMAETDSQTASIFFRQFYIPILQDVLFVLTDSDHKSGFKTQGMLLARMFQLVESGKITEPLYTPEQAAPGTSNKQFIQQYTANLLQQAFQNLKEVQIQHFVNGLFTLNEDSNKFKTHLRDFLISLKEYTGDNPEDNAHLFAEDREQEKKMAQDAERERAMKVGGLIKPADLDQDDEL
jgi:exportin-1